MAVLLSQIDMIQHTLGFLLAVVVPYCLVTGAAIVYVVVKLWKGGLL